MNPDLYATIAAQIVAGTTTLRITVGYFTHPSSGTTPFYTGIYEYDLKDRAVTDDYIEADLRRQAAIVSDGLRRYTTIADRIGAINGNRVRLT